MLTSGLPLVTVAVGVSVPQRRELEASRLPVPGPVRMDLLISTGARNRVLDRETLAPLGLAPLGPVGEVSLVLQPTLRPRQILVDHRSLCSAKMLVSMASAKAYASRTGGNRGASQAGPHLDQRIGTQHIETRS